MKPLSAAEQAVSEGCRHGASVQLEADDIAELTTLLPPEKVTELLNHPKFKNILHKHDHLAAGDNLELDDTSTVSGDGMFTPKTYATEFDGPDPLQVFHTRVKAQKIVAKAQTTPNGAEVPTKSNWSKRLSGWRGWLWLNAIIITFLSCFLATVIKGSMCIVSDITDRYVTLRSPEHHQGCTGADIAYRPSPLAARLNNMDLFKIVAHAYPDGWKDHWDNARRGIDREGLKPLQHIYKHHIDSKGFPDLDDIVKLLNRFEHGQQYSVYELTEVLRAWGFKDKSPAVRYRGSL